MATPDALSVTRTSEAAQQLHLRLFMHLDIWKEHPPERALWRELIILARADLDSNARHAAWCFYGRSDKAGFIKDYSLQNLADDMGVSKRTAQRSAASVCQARIVKPKRHGQRAASDYHMNGGGLREPRRPLSGAGPESGAGAAP